VKSILDRHKERFQATPGDSQAFESLEEHLFLAGDWTAVTALYEHRLTAPALAANPKERAQVRFRLGQVLEERLADHERAIESFASVLRDDPGHLQALAQLRRIHLLRGNWEVALQIAEVEIELPMRPAERADLLCDVGSLWLDRLGDEQQALAQFQRALEEQPKHRAALKGAARAFESCDRPHDAAAAWEQLSDLQKGPPRAAAEVALAKLAAGPLHQEERASDLYRRALGDDPNNRDALCAVAQQAEERGQWPLLADLLERRFDQATDEDADLRADLAARLGKLHSDPLDNPRAAEMWCARAAELGSESALVYEFLADFARDREDDGALLQFLAHSRELRGDAAPVSLLLELASLHSDFGEDDRALVELQFAVARAPGDELALEALSDTLARLGRNEELIDILELRAANAGDDAAGNAAALSELGALQEEHLADPSAACQTYERAFRADPLATGVAAALERLYRKAEDWEPLCELLESVARSAPFEDRPATLCALAELRREHFDDTEGASHALHEALQIDPHHLGAHRGLQRLAKQIGDEDAVLRACQAEAAITVDHERLSVLISEIVGIFEGRGEIDSALSWLTRRVEAFPGDPDALAKCAEIQEQLGRHRELAATLSALDSVIAKCDRGAVRRRLGLAEVKAGQIDRAIAAYRSAVDIDANDVDALGALAEQLASANRIEELVSVRRQLAELLPNPERARCLDSLVDLLANRVGDVTGAIEVSTRLVCEPDAPAGAVERLEQLLERSGRYDELVNHLSARIATLQDDRSTAGEISLRLGGILLEHSSRFDEAAVAFRSALNRTPSSRTAREGLERALRASGNPGALAGFLGDQVRTSPDPDVRERCAFERACLFSDELNAEAEAAAELQRIAATAADPLLRRRAAEHLEALLEHAGAWTQLRSHLESRLEGARDRAGLHERIGRLCRDYLDDAGGALHHLHAATELAPDRASTWQQLADLCEAAGRPADAIAALEGELETNPDRDREFVVRSRAGRCCIELAAPDRAAPHYQRMFELDPSNSYALQFLIDRCRMSGDVAGEVELLEKALSATDGAERSDDEPWAAERSALRIRIAELLAGDLDDPDGAIAILEPALGEIGPCSAVASPLAELYQRAGHRDELIALLESTADACDDEAERADWTVRLGDYLRKAGRNREAAAAYRQALTDRPDDREVQAGLCEIYRHLGEDESLARLLEVELARCAGGLEVPVRLELAELLAGSQDRSADALIHLRRVLQIEPGHAAALDQAIELARKLDQTHTLLELLDTAVDVGPMPAARAQLLSQRGKLLAEISRRPDEAIAAYREALHLDCTRVGDRAALRELLAAQGDWDGVLDCLYHESRDAEGSEQIRLLEFAVNVAGAHGSPDDALPWLDRLRRACPQDAAVAARISQAHRAANRPSALLLALENEATLAEEPAPLHRERARILGTQLESPVRAAAALEAALESAPDDIETLTQLEALYRRTGRDRERARVLATLITVSTGDTRISHLCDAASLYAGRLSDPQRAAEYLLAAVAASRGSSIYPELLRALGGSLRAVRRPDAWARCAEEELKVLDPESPVLSDRRRELQRELAATYELELGRPHAALRHLRALARLQWSETHGAGTEELDAIENALLRLLRRAQSPIELEKHLAAHVARRADHAGCWLELAHLREECLRTPASAADAYRAAAELRPDDIPAIRGLRRCAEVAGSWEAVAESLQLELDAGGEFAPQQRAALLRRLGDIRWHEMGSTTRASRCYAAALEADPQDFTSLRALQRLLGDMEDWRGALDLYESELEMLGDSEPERRREVALRAGAIARDHVDDPQRALRAYELAADIGELPLPQRAELAELHARAGDTQAFAEEFTAWCDAEASPAASDDHLRLAKVLEELGRVGEAAERCDQALAGDGGSLRAWIAAARLRECCGDAPGAAEALGHAAELSSDDEATMRLRCAGELCEPHDSEAALEHYHAAARRSPMDAAICAAITRMCSVLDDSAETLEMANRTLDLVDSGSELAAPLRFETALIGARAARTRGDDEAALRCYASALSVEPEDADALAEYAETLAGLGELSRARCVLEKRLAMDAADDRRALHLAMLGAALEDAGELDAARTCLEESIAEDPDLDRSHADLIRLHESANRIDDGIACLERWADGATSPGERGQRLLRAAEWELRHPGRAEAAERHLREVLEADLGLAAAWEKLATLLWDLDRVDEALDVAAMGSEGVVDPKAKGRLALIRGRALEQRGDRREAAEAFGAAAQADVTCIEAALSRARLLRGLGEWRPAAETLQEFADRHPGGDLYGLADVLQQLGRLLAGPLEDVEGAILAYRRAVEVDPERVDSRAALAEFLSHRPADRDEALEHHRALLESDPTHAPSLRVLLRIARESGDTRCVARGTEILRALGIASPRESDTGSSDSQAPFAGNRRLADPLWEMLRRAAVEAAHEIATALQSPQAMPAASSSDSATEFRAAALVAEGELAAPALIPLDDAKLAEVLTLTAALALDPERLHGDGHLVNAMSAAIRRRTRRRLRRILSDVSLQEIGAIDFVAWRQALRALSAAVALDATGSDLRTALAVLIEAESDHAVLDLPEGADLTPYVAAYPQVRAFLRRVLQDWLSSLGAGT